MFTFYLSNVGKLKHERIDGLDHTSYPAVCCFVHSSNICLMAEGLLTSPPPPAATAGAGAGPPPPLPPLGAASKLQVTNHRQIR